MTNEIIMIHGMWGTGEYWVSFKHYFEAEGFICHTPTLRYHNIKPGEAPDPKLGTTSLLDYADDLEALITGLEKPPIVIGHSMGGLLAQILASRGLVKSAVLLTPASPAGINALKYSVIKGFWEVLARWGFWKKPHRLSLQTSAYSMLNQLSLEEQKHVHEQFVYESGRAAAEIGFWLLDSRHASRVDSSQVNCPVLVVAGTEDRITPASVVQKIANKYQHVSTYKAFEGHAHWLMAEPGWETIAAYIHHWINENTP